MKISNKTLRDVQRAFHLALAAVIGTYVYSPWGGHPAFDLITKLVVIPILSVTGLVMWQMPTIMKWLKGGASKEAST